MRNKTKLLKRLFLVIFLVALLNYLIRSSNSRINLNQSDTTKQKLERILEKSSSNLIETASIRKLPIIFIGGYGRSGTTLMRAILDVHPNIRCGPETKIIPRMLNFLNTYLKPMGVRHDLNEAGIDQSLIEEATSSFIYQIVDKRQNSKNERACLKDPDILYHMKYLHGLFPNAKFIHMYRDGRSAAYSFMLKVKEKNITVSKFLRYLRVWDVYNMQIDRDCRFFGSKYCLQVKYEDLVQEPEQVLRRVMNFLNESWTGELLKHEEHIDKEVKVSKLEWSSDQIKKPINKDALRPVWLEKLPDLTVDDFTRFKMLARFGYNLTMGLKKRHFTASIRSFPRINFTSKITSTSTATQTTTSFKFDKENRT